MTDLISRQGMIDTIMSLPNCPNGFSDTYDKACIIGLIDDQPTIDPVKHGWWIAEAHKRSKCSICGGLIPIHKVVFRGEVIWEEEGSDNYCPNCGAKMGGDENADEITK